MNSDPESEDKVEATFVLLKAAKKLESESRYWPATEKYVEAHKLLTVLAEEKNTEAASAKTNNDEISSSGIELEGTQQIAELYSSKADEYWKQSRRCLILAMEEEKKLDEQDDPPNIRDLLDDDQARDRNRSFSVLFSRIVEEEPPLEATQAQDKAATAPQPVANEGDLETRLTALNQSLPSDFKTVDERMSDVHKGMGKLGMSSIYTQPKSSYNAFEDEIEKSEDEQIDEILAQAKDEVTMDRMNRESSDTPITAQAVSAIGNDDSSLGDDSESGDSEGDELLDNDQLGMKTIHKKVVKAQMKLAELLALVDQARTKRVKEDMEEEEEIYKNDNGDAEDSDDEDSFREVQKHDVAFLMMTGKKKLKSAQRDLKKALAEWDDLIL